jgi:hypothetical protein
VSDVKVRIVRGCYEIRVPGHGVKVVRPSGRPSEADALRAARWLYRTLCKGPTATKARQMLHDKRAGGRPLTERQRRYFGAVAGRGNPGRGEFVWTAREQVFCPDRRIDRLGPGMRAEATRGSAHTKAVFSGGKCVGYAVICKECREQVIAKGSRGDREPYACDRCMAREKKNPIKSRTPRSVVGTYRKLHGQTGGVVGHAAKTAMDLARAEHEARRRGWEVTIEPDWELTRESGTPMWQYDIRDRQGRILASLGGVDVDSGPYSRQVGMELAYEALREKRGGSHRGIAGRKANIPLPLLALGTLGGAAMLLPKGSARRRNAVRFVVKKRKGEFTFDVFDNARGQFVAARFSSKNQAQGVADTLEQHPEYLHDLERGKGLPQVNSGRNAAPIPFSYSPACDACGKPMPRGSNEVVCAPCKTRLYGKNPRDRFSLWTAAQLKDGRWEVFTPGELKHYAKMLGGARRSFKDLEAARKFVARQSNPQALSPARARLSAQDARLADQEARALWLTSTSPVRPIRESASLTLGQVRAGRQALGRVMSTVRNPLTRAESVGALTMARGDLFAASTDVGQGRAYQAGRADGRARSVYRYGPADMQDVSEGVVTQARAAGGMKQNGPCRRCHGRRTVDLGRNKGIACPVCCGKPRGPRKAKNPLAVRETHAILGGAGANLRDSANESSPVLSAYFAGTAHGKASVVRGPAGNKLPVRFREEAQAIDARARAAINDTSTSRRSNRLRGIDPSTGRLHGHKPACACISCSGKMGHNSVRKFGRTA